MVAVISGSTLGLVNSSLGTLGATGGNATPDGFVNAGGSASGSIYVNTVTGNLIIQNMDESLSGLGADFSFLRTYNSKGLLNDADGDNWRWNAERSVTLAGTANIVGSTITRTSGDGSTSVFDWDEGENAYISTDGAGAHDVIALVNGEWRYTEGSSQLSEYYDETTGGLDRFEDKAGNLISYGYDANDRISSITDSGSGQRFDFTYTDTTGSQLESVLTVDSGNGTPIRQVDYEYTNGLLTAVNVDLAPDTSNSYDSATSIRTVYGYDTVNGQQVVSSIAQYSAGTNAYQLSEFTHELINGEVRVTEVQDSNGTTSFAYNGNETTVTVTGGPQTVYVSNSEGLLIEVRKIISPTESESTTYGYNDKDDVVEMVDARGNAVRYYYDENGNRVLEVDAEGNYLSRTYSDTNQLLSETIYTVASAATQPLAQTTSGEIPALPGDLGDGLTSRFIYNSNNQLRFSISAEGRVSENVYDGNGNLTSTLSYDISIDAGLLTTYAADAANPTETEMVNLFATEQTEVASQSAFQYDYRGNLERSTSYAKIDANGAGVLNEAAVVNDYVYDQHGQLLSEITVRGNARDQETEVASYVYDGVGRLISKTGANGTTTTAYNGELRQKIVTRYLDTANTITGVVTTSVYDERGKLLSITQDDAENLVRSTSYAYDEAGRLRLVQDAQGNRTWTFYDKGGRVSYTVDKKGGVTGFVYNESGQLEAETRYANQVTDTSNWYSPGVAWRDGSFALDTLVEGIDYTVNTNDDRGTYYEYDNAGRLERQYQIIGAQTENSYDGASRLVQSQTGDRITQFFYDDDGLLRGSINAEGEVLQHRYDNVGRLIETVRYGQTVSPESVTDFSNVLVSLAGSDTLSSHYFYDAMGRQIGRVNEQGFLSETAWNEALNQRLDAQYMTAVTATGSDTLTTLRAQAGEAQTVTSQFDGFGRILTTEDVSGTTSRNYYDEAGRLFRSVSAEGSTDERSAMTRYNAYGEATGMVSGVGAAGINELSSTAALNAAISDYGVEYSYDDLGRKVKSTGPDGRSTHYYYDELGRQGLILQYVNSDSSGNGFYNVRLNFYSRFGEVTDTRQLEEQLTLTSEPGIQLTPTEMLGVVELMSDRDQLVVNAYTQRGQLETSTDGEGNTTRFEYNDYAEQTDIYSADGSARQVRTHLDYDKLGRLRDSYQDADGINLHSSSTAYDGFGRIDTLTDANGNTTQTLYFDQSRTVATQSPLGYINRTTVDAYGRELERVDALGNATTYSYDDINRTFTVTTPQNLSVTTELNAQGETWKVTDAKNIVTENQYTKDGQLDTVTVDGVLISDNDYDNSGRLESALDGDGREVRYYYDAANRVIQQVTDPEGEALSTWFKYDGIGRQIAISSGANFGEAGAVETRYIYNANGQLEQSIVDPAGEAISTVYEYDERNNRTLTHRGQADANGNHILTLETTETVYNSLNRVAQTIVDPDGLALTTQYFYDNNGNLTRQIEPKGNGTTGYSTWFVYDAENRVSHSVNALGEVTEYVYDARSQMLSERHYANRITLDAAWLNENVNTSVSGLVQTDNDQLNYHVYDQDGRERFILTTTEDTNWVITESRYDKNNNIKETRRYDTYFSQSEIDALIVGNRIEEVGILELLAAYGYLTEVPAGQGDISATSSGGAVDVNDLVQPGPVTPVADPNRVDPEPSTVTPGAMTPVDDPNRVEEEPPSGVTPGPITSVNDPNRFEVTSSVTPNPINITFTNSMDIGDVAANGSLGYAASTDTYTIQGSGRGIGWSADEYHFAYETVTGDFDARVQVTDISGSDFARGGLAIRESLSATSPNLGAFIDADKAFQSGERAAEGSYQSLFYGGFYRSGDWVRLTREGNTFKAYASGDGEIWHLLNTFESTLTQSAVYLGLVVTSTNDGVVAEGVFDHFSVVDAVVPDESLVTDVVGAGETQTIADNVLGSQVSIGGVSVVGNASYNDATGTYTIQGSGKGLGGHSDENHFAYEAIQGDFDAKVQVTNISGSTFARGGLAIRQNLGAMSKNIGAFIDADQRFMSGIRQEEGEWQSMDFGGFYRSGDWVRLTREGDTFKAYASADGETWQLINTFELEFTESTVYLGLAVSSINDGVMAEGVFDHFSVVDAILPDVSPIIDVVGVSETQTIADNVLGSQTPIGGVSVIGSASYDDITGTYTIQGSGKGAGGSSDENHFAYEAIQGDFDARVQVTDISGSAFARGGLVIREHLGAMSKNIGAFIDADQRFLSGARQVEGSWQSMSYGGFYRVGDWVRLTREGDTFKAYASGDGENWQLLNTFELSFAESTVYLGLAVSSINDGVMAQGIFDNFSVVNAVVPDESLITDLTGAINQTIADNLLVSQTPIGGVKEVGDASYDATAGAFTLHGSGKGIGGGADEMQFAYSAMQGDFDARVRVINLENTAPLARAGLMLRDSLDGRALSVGSVINGDGRFQSGARYSFGSYMQMENEAYYGNGDWVRLTREGNTFRVYASSDGENWNLMETYEVEFSSETVYLGLAMSSAVDGVLGEAVFDNFSVVNTVVPDESPITDVPGVTNQTIADNVLGSQTPIGGVEEIGDANYDVSTGRFTLHGSGKSIGGGSDELQFAYEAIQGDFDAQVRVVNLEYTDYSARAGLMLRDSLDARAISVTSVINAGGDFQSGARFGFGSYMSTDTGGSYTNGDWVRLKREGNIFTVYASHDGTTWEQIDSYTVNFTSDVVYLGLAVSSANDGVLAEAVFDNFSITGEATTNLVTEPVQNFESVTRSYVDAALGETQITHYSYDSLNRLKTFTNAENNTTENFYDTRGNLTRVVDANGNSTWNIYNNANQLVYTINGEGEVTEFNYDAIGNLHHTRQYFNRLADISGLGNVVNFVSFVEPAEHAEDRRSFTVYDGANREKYTLTASDQNKWVATENIYNAVSDITRTTRFGTELTDAEIAAIETASGNQDYLITEGEVSSLSSLSTATTRDSFYAYDTAGRLKYTVKGTEGGSENIVTENRYDDNSNVEAKIEYANYFTGDLYGLEGVSNGTPVWHSIDEIATIQVFSPQRSRRLPDATLPIVLTKLSDIQFSGEARILITDLTPENIVAIPSMQVTNEGLELDVSDIIENLALGETQTIELVVTGGGPTSFNLNIELQGRANLEEFESSTTINTSENDRTFEYSFDELNRLTKEYSPEGEFGETPVTGRQKTSYEYDAFGQLTQKTAGILSTSTDDNSTAGRTTEFVYDRLGRARFEINASETLTENIYDVFGNLEYNLAYDVDVGSTERNIASLEAAKGNAALGDEVTHGEHYQYDANNRIISTTDALLNTEEYAYDAVGNRIWLQNKEGNVWRYYYDSVNRLEYEVSPETTVSEVDNTNGTGSLLNASTDEFWDAGPFTSWDSINNEFEYTYYNGGNSGVKVTETGANAGWQTGFRPARVEIEVFTGNADINTFKIDVQDTSGETIGYKEQLIEFQAVQTISVDLDFLSDDIDWIDIGYVYDAGTGESGWNIKRIEFFDSVGNIIETSMEATSNSYWTPTDMTWDTGQSRWVPNGDITRLDILHTDPNGNANGDWSTVKVPTRLEIEISTGSLAPENVQVDLVEFGEPYVNYVTSDDVSLQPNTTQTLVIDFPSTIGYNGPAALNFDYLVFGTYGGTGNDWYVSKIEFFYEEEAPVESNSSTTSNGATLTSGEATNLLLDASSDEWWYSPDGLIAYDEDGWLVNTQGSTSLQLLTTYDWWQRIYATGIYIEIETGDNIEGQLQTYADSNETSKTRTDVLQPNSTYTLTFSPGYYSDINELRFDFSNLTTQGEFRITRIEFLDNYRDNYPVDITSDSNWKSTDINWSEVDQSWEGRGDTGTLTINKSGPDELWNYEGNLRKLEIELTTGVIESESLDVELWTADGNLSVFTNVSLNENSTHKIVLFYSSSRWMQDPLEKIVFNFSNGTNNEWTVTKITGSTVDPVSTDPQNNNNVSEPEYVYQSLLDTTSDQYWDIPNWNATEQKWELSLGPSRDFNGDLYHWFDSYTDWNDENFPADRLEIDITTGSDFSGDLQVWAFIPETTFAGGDWVLTQANKSYTLVIDLNDDRFYSLYFGLGNQPDGTVANFSISRIEFFEKTDIVIPGEPEVIETSGGTLGEPVVIQSEKHLVRQVQYNAFGDVEEITEGLDTDALTDFALRPNASNGNYAPDLNAITLNMEGSRTTIYGFDKLGRQIRTENPGYFVQAADGVGGSFVSDNSTGGQKQSVEVLYDAFGNAVRSETKLAGEAYQSEYKVYDIHNRLVYEVDAEGNYSRYQHNDALRQEVFTRYGDKLDVLESGYYTAAMLDSHVNGLASTVERRSITTHYDVLGRKVSTVSDEVENNFESVQNSTTGNGVLNTYTAALTSVFKYNEFGQLILESNKINQSDSADTHYYYDSLGRQYLVVDAEGYVTKTSYDAFGNVAETIQYSNKLSLPVENVDWNSFAANDDRKYSIVYDTLNRQTQVYDHNGYDVFDDVNEEFNQNANNSGDLSTSYLSGENHYDKLGNVLSQIDANGNTTNYVYSELGVLESMSGPASTVALDGAIDPFLQTVTAGITTNFSVDKFGNIVREEYSVGGAMGGSRTVYHEYDFLGNEIRSTDAEGNVTERTFDTFGRIKSETTAVEATEVSHSIPITVEDITATGSTLLSSTQFEWTGSSWVNDGGGNLKIEGDWLAGLRPGQVQVQITYYGNPQTATFSEATVTVHDKAGNAYSYSPSGTDDLTHQSARTITVNIDQLESGDLDYIDLQLSPNGQVSGPLYYVSQIKFLNIVDPDAGEEIVYSSISGSGIYDMAYAHDVRREFHYDKTGRQTTTIDVFTENGVETRSGITQNYNAFGELTQDMRIAGINADLSGGAEQIVRAYAYDAAGRLMRSEGNEGITKYYYDLQGNITRQEVVSDDSANPAEKRVTERYYDALGRVLTERQPSYEGIATSMSGIDETVYETPTGLNPEITQSYDRWGNIASLTDAAGYTTDYEYNSRNQAIKVTLPETDVMQFVGGDTRIRVEQHLYYDKLGSQLGEEYKMPTGDALRKQWNVLDTLGRVTQTFDGTTSDDGIQRNTQYVYDGYGNRVGTKDAYGTVFVEAFNANNQVTSRSVLRNTSQSREWVNAATSGYYSGVTALTDEISQVMISSWFYDQAGRKFAEMDGSGKADLYKFDERGNIIRHKNRGDIVIDYQYNTNGLQTGSTRYLDVEADGTPVSTQVNTTEFSTADFEFGMVSSVSAPNGEQWNYYYNDFGQLELEVDANDAGNFRSYNYLNNGMLDSISEYILRGAAETEDGIDYQFTNNTSSFHYDIRGNRVVESHTWEEAGDIEEVITFDTVRGHFTIEQTVYHSFSNTPGSRATWLHFDEHNRLDEIVARRPDDDTDRTDLEQLQYHYDEMGNRRKIETRYRLPGDSMSNYPDYKVVWNKFDSAGRVLVDGGVYKDTDGDQIVDSFAIINAGTNIQLTSGEFITYDANGRKLNSFKAEGGEVVYDVSVPNPGDDTTRSRKYYGYDRYSYTDLGQVEGVSTFRVTDEELDEYLVDSPAYKTEADFAALATPESVFSPKAVNFYDLSGYRTYTVGGVNKYSYSYTGDGRLQSQSTTINDVLDSNVYYYYDDAGNIERYRVVSDNPNSGQNNIYNYDYSYEMTYSGYQNTAIIVSAEGAADIEDLEDGETNLFYNARGNLIATVVDSSDYNEKIHRSFGYDTEGRLLSKSEFKTPDNYQEGTKTQEYYYSGQNAIANIGDFGATINPISSTYNGGATPNTYTVAQGDSLALIAQRIYGDSSLWYVLADANGLSMGPSETFGQSDSGRTLIIPNANQALSNNSTTFKPFDLGSAIGDLTPNMQMPPPPDCNMLASFVMAVVAVIVTVYTAGQLGPYMSQFWAGFVGGASGSVASQAVGVAAGVQDDIDFGAALVSGLASGVSYGLADKFAAGAEVVDKAENVSKFALAAKIGGADPVLTGLGQSIVSGTSAFAGMAAGQLNNRDSSFSWSSLAASTVSGFIQGGAGLPGANDFTHGFADSLKSGLVSLTSSVAFGMHGHQEIRQAAVDAFGNAIGSGIVGYYQGVDARNKDAMEMNMAVGASVNSSAGTGINERAVSDIYENMFRRFESQMSTTVVEQDKDLVGQTGHSLLAAANRLADAQSGSQALATFVEKSDYLAATGKIGTGEVPTEEVRITAYRSKSGESTYTSSSFLTRGVVHNLARNVIGDNIVYVDSTLLNYSTNISARNFDAKIAEDRSNLYQPVFSGYAYDNSFTEYGVGAIEMVVSGFYNTAVRAVGGAASVPYLVGGNDQAIDFQNWFTESFSYDLQSEGAHMIAGQLEPHVGYAMDNIQRTRDQMENVIGDGATTVIFAGTQAVLEAGGLYAGSVRSGFFKSGASRGGLGGVAGMADDVLDPVVSVTRNSKLGITMTTARTKGGGLHVKFDDVPNNNVIDGLTELDPRFVRTTQTTTKQQGATLRALTESMQKNGFVVEPDKLIDVVRMPDGGLTSLDNTRIVAADLAGVKIQARVHNFDDLLPNDEQFISRFIGRKGEVPINWGEAVQNRISNQSSSFRNTYPEGSPFISFGKNY